MTPERIAELRALCEERAPGSFAFSAAGDALPELLDEIDQLRDALKGVKAIADQAKGLVEENNRLTAELETVREAKGALENDTVNAEMNLGILTAELAAANKRAEAAVSDLAFACGSQPSASADDSICDICKNKKQDGTCPFMCFMNSLGAANHWEWRELCEQIAPDSAESEAGK